MSLRTLAPMLLVLTEGWSQVSVLLNIRLRLRSRRTIDSPCRNEEEAIAAE
jgi:hypothetical protein